MSPIPLNELERGVPAEVSALKTEGAMRRRLLDIGFTPGAAVEALFSACTGGMRAYLVGGAVIALRSEDAGGVRVCPLRT